MNTRSVLAMRTIGKGRAGLESFCGVMDMLPPVSTSVACQEVAPENTCGAYVPSTVHMKQAETSTPNG